MNKFVAYMSTFGLVALYGASAFAQGADAPANHFSMYAMFAIGAGLAIGLAAIGGALGQGRAAAAQRQQRGHAAPQARAADGPHLPPGRA